MERILWWTMADRIQLGHLAQFTVIMCVQSHSRPVKMNWHAC